MAVHVSFISILTQQINREQFFQARYLVYSLEMGKKVWPFHHKGDIHSPLKVAEIDIRKGAWRTVTACCGSAVLEPIKRLMSRQGGRTVVPASPECERTRKGNQLRGRMEIANSSQTDKSSDVLFYW